MEEERLRYNDNIIFQQIRNKLVSKIYKEMAHEAGQEIVAVNNISKNLTENIIIRAIKQERNTEASEKQIKKWFYDTRNK